MMKRKADFVSIPCFAVKYYYSFTVEGRKKHSLIPNFWNLLSGNLCLPCVPKTVGPETTVLKTYPGHILNTYKDKVQIFSPFLHPVFHWEKIQVDGKRSLYSVLQLVSIWTGTGSQQQQGLGWGRTEEGHTLKPCTLPLTSDNRSPEWKTSISAGV